MNRNLMAGCAAVALTLGCGSALAQSTFNVGLGGDAFFEFGYVSQDRNSNLRSTEFANRLRVVITPSAKADNGLEYGARVRIRAASGVTPTGVDGDRAFLFMQHAQMGRLELGTVDGPSDQTYVARPQDWQIFGLYDQWRRFVTASTVQSGAGTAASPFRYSGADLANHGQTAAFASGTEGFMLLNSATAMTRINYFSPRFAGFQVGLSYSPRTDDFVYGVNRSKFNATGTYQGGFQDIYELTANYAGEFSGVGIKASAGFEGGSAKQTAVGGAKRHDLTAYQAGLQLSYAGFAVGGGYVNSGKSGGFKVDPNVKQATTWNLGAQYTTGPLVVGLGFQRSEDAGALTAAGLVNAPVGALNNKRTTDAFTAGALYTVAPGLRAGLEYTYYDAKSRQSTANANRDDKGSVVILRAAANF